MALEDGAQEGRRATWAWASKASGRLSWGQGIDLKQQAEKEESRTSSRGMSKTFRDAWRPAPENTKPPHLPFIYCVFNSEHLIESQSGCP